MENRNVENAEEANDNVVEQENCLTKLRNFALRQFLSIGTIFSIILGIFVPQPAVYLNERIPLSMVCVIIICFAFGLRLRLEEANSAIKSYKEIMVGLVLGLFVAPVLGTSILNKVRQFGPLIANASELNWKNVSNTSNEGIDLPILGPLEFRLGLQITCMSPGAVAATVIMVTSANGHRGLSILLSILCAMLSVFTVPVLITWLIPSLQRLDIHMETLLLNAMLTILVPLAIGRCLRFLKPVKKCITKVDRILKYIVIGSVLLLVLGIVSQTSESGNLQKVSAVNIVCVVALGTSFRTLNVIICYGLLTILPGFSKKSTVALSLSTGVPLMGIVVTIVYALPEKAGDKGLMALPVIFVFLTTLLTVNCLVMLVVKVEGDAKTTKKSHGVEPRITEDSTVNSQINEVAAFTIYTDEVFVK